MTAALACHTPVRIDLMIWALCGTAAANNMRGKTGTLTYVNALSGYITTKGGQLLILSMMGNNYTGPGRDVTAVVRSRMKRGPAALREKRAPPVECHRTAFFTVLATEWSITMNLSTPSKPVPRAFFIGP